MLVFVFVQRRSGRVVLCLFSVWFVGVVSSVVFCDVGVDVWVLVLSLLMCCCDVGVCLCCCSVCCL